MFVVTVCPEELLTLTKNMEMLLVPIIVRLQGTNAAKELIDNSGMPILSAVEFQDS
jgi:succinyl-CoA synthetase beta subunit